MGNDYLLSDIGLWISKRPQTAMGVDYTTGADYLRAVTEPAAFVTPEIQSRTDAGKPGNIGGFPTRRCIDRLGHPGYTLADEVNSAYFGRFLLRSVGGAVTTAQQGGSAAHLHTAKLLNPLLSRQLPLTSMIEILGGANFRYADMVVDSLSLSQNRAEVPRYSVTLIGSGKHTRPNGVNVQQVETATAAGTVTATGNAKATVTAGGMSGSPKIVLFAVANTDTPTVWAGKARVALDADPVIRSFFFVSGSGTSIILTARVAAANDATMNVALDNDTSTGITAAPTSANTTAGAKTLTDDLDILPCFDGNLTEVFWTDQFGLRTLTDSGCAITGWSSDIGNATKLNDRCINDPTITITDGSLTVTPAHVKKMKHGQIAASVSFTVLLDDTLPYWLSYAVGDTLTDVTVRPRGPIIASTFRHSVATVYPKASIASKTETEVEGEAAMQFTIEPFWDTVTGTAVRVEVQNDESSNYD